MTEPLETIRHLDFVLRKAAEAGREALPRLLSVADMRAVTAEFEQMRAEVERLRGRIESYKATLAKRTRGLDMAIEGRERAEAESARLRAENARMRPVVWAALRYAFEWQLNPQSRRATNAAIALWNAAAAYRSPETVGTAAQVPAERHTVVPPSSAHTESGAPPSDASASGSGDSAAGDQR